MICDRWDAHHCIRAAQRAMDMALRINVVVAALREQGALTVLIG